MIIIGDKEIESKCVSIRSYGSKESKTLNFEELKKNWIEC